MINSKIVGSKEKGVKKKQSKKSVYMWVSVSHKYRGGTTVWVSLGSGPSVPESFLFPLICKLKTSSIKPNRPRYAPSLLDGKKKKNIFSPRDHLTYRLSRSPSDQMIRDETKAASSSVNVGEFLARSVSSSVVALFAFLAISNGISYQLVSYHILLTSL
jgi:hypothetical protein